jgi:radical SAM superfamily enzyme YgiQ (UPF0313 family)
MDRNTLEINNILLINPPESSRGGSTSVPLGLMYIAGLLRKNSIPVNILDACLEGWDSIKKGLAENNPTIVGIACPSYARTKSLKVAEIVKDYNKNIKVILGGHHPSLMGKQILENYPFVDMICIGEGEYPMLELSQGVDLKNIPGLGFRRGNEIIINNPRPEISDLDKLPMPAWDCIDPRRYGTNSTFVFDGVDFSKEIGACISFSRGCIGRCNFCSNHCMWAKWKHRSPKNVADELELLNKKYNIRCFAFNDDCFSVNRKAAMELCNEILERKLKIYFSIVTRTDCIDEELLGILKEAGCCAICFGIEAASPKLLKIMHKPIKIEQSQKAIQLVKSFGIRSIALVIAGAVGETRETINETISFLNHANPTESGIANGLMIFPGTEIYEIAKRQKLIDDSFWLTDYNYMIYTGENSRLKLNMFFSAIHNRKKLSRFFIINALQYHRFVTREIEMGLKKFLEWMGLLKVRNKSNKPKVFYGKYTSQGRAR